MVQVLLSGEFDHTLDPKGRVTLPARYREHFSRSAVLVLLPNREPCLHIYHPDEWNKFDENHLEPLDVFGKPEDSWTTRDIYKKLDEVEPDKQGRVLIPAQRIKELGLTGKVKILGNRNHLEIWNPATLEEYEQRRSGNA
jgi:MraZ protein